MLAEMVRQEQISNELANVNTPGYKADHSAQAGFGELLLHNTVTGGLGRPARTRRPDRRNENGPDPGPGPRKPANRSTSRSKAKASSRSTTAAGVRYTPATASSAPTPKATSPTRPATTVPRPGWRRRCGLRAPTATVPRLRPRRLSKIAGARKGRRLALQRQRGRRRHRPRPGPASLEESAADPTRTMVQMIASFRSLEGRSEIDPDDRRNAQRVGRPRGGSVLMAVAALFTAAAGMEAQQTAMDALSPTTSPTSRRPATRASGSASTNLLYPGAGTGRRGRHPDRFPGPAAEVVGPQLRRGLAGKPPAGPLDVALTHARPSSKSAPTAAASLWTRGRGPRRRRRRAAADGDRAAARAADPDPPRGRP